LSNTVNNEDVSVIVCDTIQPHKSITVSGDDIIKLLRKVGLKNDGSGVLGDGLKITCKYHTKPTVIRGWWESNLKVPFRVELTSKKTGQKYFVDFEKEPTAEDIEYVIDYYDNKKSLSR
jgi:hypothetical protein